MSGTLRSCVFLTLLAVLAGTSATAQDAFLGQPEFIERCAVCHGDSGAGDGIVGELFAQRPKDLQLLARENGGVFPFAAVYESIDGRRDITAHGRTAMPIWGNYLMTESLEGRGMDPDDAQLVVQARILALVQYIQSIQLP